jgi:hypothetical protein
MKKPCPFRGKARCDLLDLPFFAAGIAKKSSSKVLSNTKNLNRANYDKSSEYSSS